MRGAVSREVRFGRQSHDFKHSQNNVFGTVLISLGLLWIAGSLSFNFRPVSHTAARISGTGS